MPRRARSSSSRSTACSACARRASTTSISIAGSTRRDSRCSRCRSRWPDDPRRGHARARSPRRTHLASASRSRRASTGSTTSRSAAPGSRRSCAGNQPRPAPDDDRAQACLGRSTHAGRHARGRPHGRALRARHVGQQRRLRGLRSRRRSRSDRIRVAARRPPARVRVDIAARGPFTPSKDGGHLDRDREHGRGRWLDARAVAHPLAGDAARRAAAGRTSFEYAGFFTPHAGQRRARASANRDPADPVRERGPRRARLLRDRGRLALAVGRGVPPRGRARRSAQGLDQLLRRFRAPTSPYR